MTKPAVSVVMAVRDSMPYLPIAVKSILSQTLSCFDFIIINDGSNQETTEYLNNLTNTDERIRIIHQCSEGLAKSLNTGIAQSDSEYIARMDADDIASPERLYRQYSYMNSNPKCVLCGTKIILIDDKGWEIGPMPSTRFSHAEILQMLLQGRGHALCHPSVLFRRSSFLEVGRYDESLSVAQDLDLFLKLSEVGELGNVESPLLKWRQHNNSVNRKRFSDWPDVKQKILISAYQRRGMSLQVDEAFLNAGLQRFRNPNLVYSQLASKSIRTLHTSIRHLSISIQKSGFNRSHAKCIASILRTIATFRKHAH